MRVYVWVSLVLIRSKMIKYFSQASYEACHIDKRCELKLQHLARQKAHASSKCCHGC